MTNDRRLYDALEICLQALEQGSDLETSLQRFPDLAAELRPLLVTAFLARSTADQEIPADVLQRSKARVLRVATQAREKTTGQFPRVHLFGGLFRLAFASLLLLVFFLIGGTGLVRAAEGALPGEGLYPVKRGWEGLRLFAAGDSQSRTELETALMQERYREVSELLLLGRSEWVSFQGIVQGQTSTFWRIAGLQVAISDQTQIDGEIVPGALVDVWGQTQGDLINAEKIQLLLAAPGNQLPLDDSLTPAPTATPVPAGKSMTATPWIEPTSTLVSTATLNPANPTPTQMPQPNANGNENEGHDNSGNDDNNNNNNDNEQSGSNGNDNDDNENDSNDNDDNDNGG